MDRFHRFFVVTLFFAPVVSLAAGDSGFNMAAQLLSAARNGNTQLVQNLINSGADVNYVDSTGVSVVCTAVMNNDTRAVQILQMYGADAANCDKQIKNYKGRNIKASDAVFFTGLSSTHKLALGAVGVAGVVGGLLFVTDAFGGDNGNDSGGGSGTHGSGGDNSGSSSSLSATFTIPYGPAMVNSTGSVEESFNFSNALDVYASNSSSTSYATNFSVMNTYGNYLLMMHGYAPFARGYMGQITLRSGAYSPVPSAVYGAKKLGTESVTGGIPVNVALITANGINAASNTSLANMFFVWSSMNGSSITDVNAASNTMISSKYFNNSVTLGNDSSSITDDTVTEDSSFDLSGNGTAINNNGASDTDNLLAKIVGGYTTGATGGDFVGFIPNGQMTIYRTGGGKNSSSSAINYYNYRALVDAASKSVTNSTTDAISAYGNYGRAKISVIANLDVIDSLYSVDVETVGDFLSVSSANYKTTFYNWVGNYYNNNVNTPAYNTSKVDASSFFTNLGISYFPLTVFSVGGVETDSSYSGEAKVATFENAAPLAFSNVDKLFMSVVAVNLPNVNDQSATASATSVSGVSTTQKYSLSQWQLGTDDTATYYRSRICGISGVGASGVDPWCFAAAGATDEQATAAAAGAAGAVKAAFSYLSNQNIFTLLALTADGAYLGTNPSTGGVWSSSDDLVGYLESMYDLPAEYQARVDNVNDSMTYLDAFKQVFGYGLINLDRATTPGKSIYYYSNGKIVSASGNAYWRSATNTAMRMSSIFGGRGATIPVSFYDTLSSVDGDVSLTRVWNMDFAWNDDALYGLYMGDTLSELKTRNTDNSVSIGNFRFGFARTERAYDDNMAGLDNLSISLDNARFGLKSDYQHYLTDGAGRFTGMANPVLALVSNAVSSDVKLKSGRFALFGRGFIGNITTEGLLNTDPAISNNFTSAKLGNAIGGESGIKWQGKNLSMSSSIGMMHESNTVLGAFGNGLFDTRGTDTNYIDSVLAYFVDDDIGFTLRGTYSWTDDVNISDSVINELSDMKSNAFAFGIRLKNLDFIASMPLAMVSGNLRYSFADFAVDADGKLMVNSCGERGIDLTPDVREYRFNASYRHSFSDWTDGALGFIYRVNPNNTNAFGNESIFMMKLSHKLGI